MDSVMPSSPPATTTPTYALAKKGLEWAFLELGAVSQNILNYPVKGYRPVAVDPGFYKIVQEKMSTGQIDSVLNLDPKIVEDPAETRLDLVQENLALNTVLLKSQVFSQFTSQHLKTLEHAITGRATGG